VERFYELSELVASVAADLLGGDLGSQREVEAQIEEGLGRVATALGAEGAHFLRDAKRQRDVVFVEWARGKPGRRNAERITMSPAARAWWEEQMAGGKPVHIEDVSMIGDEAAEVREVLAALGTASMLVVPLHRHRRFSGFVGVFHGSPRRFSVDVAALLRVTGEAFMGALGQSDDRAALQDARRELEQRNLDLERSNEDLERFAYAAAHDLKAPLARIEMALGPAGDASAEVLEVARRGVARMRRLIEDLLAYAAVGSGADVRAPVELGAVLDEVVADLAPVLASTGAQVVRGPMCTLHGQRAALTQLLQNLVGNGVKFIRDGVPPVVQVTCQPDGDGEGVTMTVLDNGIGIDPEHREHVFGVFTRFAPDDRYPGSGIGLATCARVVSRHGGRIWVEDGIDGGTAVKVWLPSS